MKKKFAWIMVLALVLVLLASCELMVPGPTERPSIGLPGEPSGTGEPTPTESAGPAVENYGFTIFPEGNYLADAKFDTDEYLPDYDADPSFIQFLSKAWRGLCQTDSTIYCFDYSSLHKEDYLIMYADKATGISGPLCGKPECLHNDYTCNAKVSSRSDGLTVYNGKLYWVDGRSKITRMNLDGTDRETVTSTAGAYDHLNNSWTVVFHRGYAYFAGSQHSAVVNGRPGGYVSIKVRPLDGGEGFTVLDKLVEGYGAECAIKPVGNDLYIMLHTYDYEDTVNLEGEFDRVEFYRWDSKTRKVEFIANVRTSPDGLGIDRGSFHPVPGDGIYLQGETTVGTDYYNCVCKYSFKTGEIEEVLPLNQDGELRFASPYFTRNYIIVQYNVSKSSSDFVPMIYVYDYSFDLIYCIGPFEEHDGNDFMGADDEFVYYLCWVGSNDDTEHGRHFIAVPFDGGDVIVID